jgi:hypothetical protein
MWDAFREWCPEIRMETGITNLPILQERKAEIAFHSSGEKSAFSHII